MFRVVECMMLKNVGYQVQPAKETLVDNPVDVAERIPRTPSRLASQKQ